MCSKSIYRGKKTRQRQKAWQKISTSSACGGAQWLCWGQCQFGMHAVSRPECDVCQHSCNNWRNKRGMRQWNLNISAQINQFWQDPAKTTDPNRMPILPHSKRNKVISFRLFKIGHHFDPVLNFFELKSVRRGQCELDLREFARKRTRIRNCAV